MGQFVIGILSLLAFVGIAVARPPKPCNRDIVFNLHNITYHHIWVFHNSTYLSAAEGHIDFFMTNNVLPYATTCAGTSTRPINFFYGEYAFNCDHPPEAPLGSSAANFTFAQETGTFKVDQTWECGRGGHQFLGYSTGNVSLDCKTEVWRNPKWTKNEVYSTTTMTCKPAALRLPAYVFERKVGGNSTGEALLTGLPTFKALWLSARSLLTR